MSTNSPQADPLRVAFLTNIVSPYRLPVLRDLSTTPDWDLSILVNAETEFDRDWTVETDELPVARTKTRTLRRKRVHRSPVEYEEELSTHVPTGLWGDLRRMRPDVVLSCELGMRTILAALYCRLHRVPLVIWTYHSRVSAGSSRLRTAYRKLLLRCSNVVAGMGLQAREVLEGWGVPSERIVDVLNTTDDAGLKDRLASPEMPARVEKLRAAHAPGRRIILIVGRLIPLKGTPQILEAWKSLPQSQRDRWTLVFVGTGPYDELLKEAAGPEVVLAGNCPSEQMADWYASADLHLFASLGDAWGLVVNEAMACGTPTLCSRYAGCCDDLVEDGRNGVVFDPTQPEDFAQALTKTLGREDLEQLGRQAAQDIAKCSIGNMAESLRRAVRMANGDPQVVEPLTSSKKVA